VKEIEVAIVTWHKDNEASRRLATIPGVGPITASAMRSLKPKEPHQRCHS
jgi:transposase